MRARLAAVIAAAAILLGGGGVWQFSREVEAQTPEDLQELQDKIREYEEKVKSLQSQAKTLSSQISYFNNQIRLTELQITKTIEEIDDLEAKITALEVALARLSASFSSRAVESYKMQRVSEPWMILLTAQDLPSFFSRYHYLKLIQEQDKELLLSWQQSQKLYEEQKKEIAALRERLTGQKQVLGEQKVGKQYLLETTKSDEKKYQELLAQARSEYEAIQAIIAGLGEEQEVGGVSQGERIASIIDGSSCNSSGTHLHFIVRKGGEVQNPFSYLKPADFENCSGSSCGSGDGDNFSPSGDWDWPIAPRIKFSQGYGETWAVKNTWVGQVYKFHNGIDIDSGDATVKAVKEGQLYRGSFTGASGCKLRYVRVKHKDTDVDTLYLHINY